MRSSKISATLAGIVLTLAAIFAGVARAARIGFDQPPSCARLEERGATGNGTHRVDQLGGFDVLQQEPAGPGTQGAERSAFAGAAAPQQDVPDRDHDKHAHRQNQREYRPGQEM